jgi:hypothetical protein
MLAAMPDPTLRKPPRQWAAAWVLGLHVLGLGLGLRSVATHDRGRREPEPPPLAVRLLKLAPAQADPRPPVTATPRLPAAAAWHPTPPAVAAPAWEPQAITLPAPTPGTSAAATPALNLTLPRAASAPWRQRHPGLDDPRANTARATLESRINAAMRGDDRLIEERLDDNTVRIRKGSSCVIVQGSRTALIDPGNQSFSRTPGMAKPC